MRKLACITFLMATSGVASAADIALVGGDVYPVSSAPKLGATVVIRGERIVSVGKDVPIPAGAKIIDCKGMRVTPGLIEASSALGLVEISLEATTVDGRPKMKDAIRAALRVEDAINLRSSLIGVARRQGLTSAVSVPVGGLISGQSAWLDLVGPNSERLASAITGPAAMHGVYGVRATGAAGGSRATAMLRLREALDEARIYQRNKNLFNRRGLFELHTSRLDLEAMQPVITGRMKLLMHANRASDIRALLRFAQKERVKIAILGAAEGWLLAEEIARARVPVVVDPTENLPFSFDSLNARSDNAAVMARAGVKVSIATFDSHNAGGLRFSLANAVRAGLPEELALAAATLRPAELYGMERKYGSLDRGKIANVVVWTGDPFAPQSHAKTVIIRGELQPVDSRQTRLAKRYLRRLGLGR